MTEELVHLAPCNGNDVNSTTVDSARLDWRPTNSIKRCHHDRVDFFNTAAIKHATDVCQRSFDITSMNVSVRDDDLPWWVSIRNETFYRSILLVYVFLSTFSRTGPHIKCDFHRLGHLLFNLFSKQVSKQFSKQFSKHGLTLFCLCRVLCDDENKA